MQSDGIKHIVWDWNGTLVDDSWLCAELASEALHAQSGRSFDLDTYKEHASHPIEKFYESVGFDFSKRSFADLSHEFLHQYHLRLTECRLHEGVESVIAQFAKRGIGASILSAHPDEFLQKEVAQFGISSLFKLVTGADDRTARGKLHLGAAHLNRLGVSASEVMIVGDTDHDAEVASHLGCHCTLIPNGHQSARRLNALSGVQVLSSVLELLERSPKIMARK